MQSTLDRGCWVHFINPAKIDSFVKKLRVYARSALESAPRKNEDIELQKDAAPYLLTIGVTHASGSVSPELFPFDIDDWGAITALTFVSGFEKRGGYWSAVGSNQLRGTPLASAGTLSPFKFHDFSGRDREMLPPRFSVTIEYDYKSKSIEATIRYSESVSFHVSITPHHQNNISNLKPYIAHRGEDDSFPHLSISSA